MINCIVLDDDPAVLFSLKLYVEQTPFLHLVAAHSNPLDALKTLQTADVQLIFIDIFLPEINGLELSRMITSFIDPVPLIVFVTAYENYAMDGYKVNALDYLMKPIFYESFLATACRAKERLENRTRVYNDRDYLFLRVEYELQKVYLKNILYLESFKDYVKIFTNYQDTFIKSLTTMKSLAEKLPADSFVRIHRSFIISVDKIDSITKTSVRIRNMVIMVSEQYKADFRKITGRWF
ncbi:LytTR family DNA-binding domain-containing protein [Mucilaginibacter sp. SG564]|uniref:LytR/AlgR family response regulator transcription factor n=1 Tax=Mucilaginibacter sp. SG564 TaxID=2587022 RepID=UPI00155821EF|nr:LytTR family DNA-binding domain-containing protein [Mucilaginibacter sp. SG564]NOW96743.1 DNA-binding LytR/AlgR family response regulator [Mucilaginibacter sp. SG564]